MSWFEQLTGCVETSPEDVRRQLVVEGSQLRSRSNGRTWNCGTLQVLSLAELREQVRNAPRDSKPLMVREILANVQALHRDPGHANALFQVASQFNLLEMVGPNVTPEDGVGIYERDFTQGPACAIAAGAGTIFRNYFAEVNGRVGQSAENQIDCLSAVGELLGNRDGSLWKMVNGYALPSPNGLAEINQKLRSLDPAALDEVRKSVQIGLHWNTQVTLDDASHSVSQAYCSALPVAYTRYSQKDWKPFASLVLEAAYEATICAAILNKAQSGDNRLFLTFLGGGAFGNDMDWIIDAMRRSLTLYRDSGLNIAIVSYRASNPRVQQLVQELLPIV